MTADKHAEAPAGNALVRAGRSWMRAGGSSQAAALTFFSLFAIGPLLALSLAIASDLLGDGRARVELRDFLQTFVDPQAAQSLVQFLEAQQRPSLRSVYTVNGLLLLIGASAFMRQLRQSLSGRRIFGPSRKREVLARVLLSRLIAFALVLAAGLLLVVLSVLSASLEATLAAIGDGLPVSSSFLSVLDSVAPLPLALLSFWLLYRFVPTQRPTARQALVAAGLVAMLFVGGKALLGIYLSRVPWGTAYGAAGSLVVTLLWLFVVNNLMLFGNQLAQELRQRAQPPEESEKRLGSET